MMYKIKEEDENYVYYLISQNLKKYRKLKKMSVAKLAEICHCSEGYIMNIESPNYWQTFSLETAWKFAQALEIDFRELLTPLEDTEEK